MNGAIPQETDAPGEIHVLTLNAREPNEARIYACGGDKVGYAYLRIEIGDKKIAMTPEQWMNLGIEAETLRIQLAGCGVIALSNTPESAAQQRPKADSPYWCASMQDVARVVDSEMALRAKVQRLTMLERELTFDERSTWGDCPACSVKHGEKCHSEIGFALGYSIGGGRPKEGAHLGRLQRAPLRVKVVPA